MKIHVNHYWTIPDEQIVRIQNRMSDIRECDAEDSPIKFMAAVYELMGTLDTVLFDSRNYEGIRRASSKVESEEEEDEQD